MRSLIVFKANDNTPYHVDLDEQSAIGIDVNIFDPIHPDVTRVNNSNEFTIPKTRNNVQIFDGIFDSSHINSSNDYNYECEYFVGNHILVTGKVYLTGATDERISLFIYDKYNVINKLKNYTFGDFEREYVEQNYYDFSDWSEDKRTFDSHEFDMTGILPNRYNVRPISGLGSDLWKLTNVSYVQGDVEVNFDSWKTKMLTYLNSIDPAYQYKVYWNACMNKWVMDMFNFWSPNEVYTNDENRRSYALYSPFVQPIDFDTPNASTEQWKTNEFLFIRNNIFPSGVLGARPYFKVKVGNRDSYHYGTTMVESIGGKRLPLRQVKPSVIKLSEMTDNNDSVVRRGIRTALNDLLGYAEIYPEFFKRVGVLLGYGASTYYTSISDTNQQGDKIPFISLLKAIADKIEEATNSGEVNGMDIQSCINLVENMTAEDYATEYPILMSWIRQMRGSHTYDLGTKYEDGVSIWSDRKKTLSASYEPEGYYADANGISAAPSMSICYATGSSSLNDWLESWKFVDTAYNAIQTYDYTYLSQEKYNEFFTITYSDTETVNLPSFRLFPISYSDDDTVTYDNITQLADEITLNISNEGQDKLYGGQLYVSTYQIFDWLQNKFDITIENIDTFTEYFTNVPDIIIHRTGQNYYWDYSTEVTTKTPRMKSMYDWLQMFCKVHSYVPVVLENRIYLRPYSSNIADIRRNVSNIFNYKKVDTTKWLACGDLQTQTYYVDFSSAENGADIHINRKSPIYIQNESLSDTPEVLYTNGAHRVLVSNVENANSYTTFKSSGSENFLYAHVNLVPTSDMLSNTGIRENNIVFGNDVTLSALSDDSVNMNTLFRPGNVTDYYNQTNLDIDFLNNLISPYPTIYEIEVYMTFDEIFDIVMASLTDTNLYYIKDLNGYYYITKIGNINGYDRKSPVTFTLYKYVG